MKIIWIERIHYNSLICGGFSYISFSICIPPDKEENKNGIQADKQNWMDSPFVQLFHWKYD